MILPFFIGTYTSPTGSQGIYQSTLNLQTGELTTPILAAKTENPSYLALHPRGPNLVCVNESAQGAVTSYSISTDLKLTYPNITKLNGSGPCYISFISDGLQIYTASYGSGDYEEVNVAGVPWSYNNNAEGEPPARAHSICTHPTLPFLFATDLGRNQLLSWTFESPTPTKSQVTNFLAGSPRHMAFSKSGNTLYVNSENNSSVTAMQINPVTGELTAFQTISTLPPDTTTKNTTAEILIHPNGKFLYVSNRGHNSIATFTINGNETLATPTITQIEAQSPRGLAIDPAGNYLLAAGQTNDIIISLKLDQKTGTPSPTGHKITLSKPVHMVFVPPQSFN